MQTKQSQSKQASQKSPTRISTNESTSASGFEGDLALIVQRTIHAPNELSPRNISFLQRTLGNRAIGKLLQHHNLSHSHTALKSISALQRTPAEDLINYHISWGNLHEDQLGAVLLGRVKQGEYAFVQQVFNELDSVDRDDVAFELIRRADDHVLTQIGTTSSGRNLLDRLFDELTSGSVAREEQEQADRILRSKTRRIDPEQFQRGMNSAKIFPYRLPGFTVLDAAPIRAERRSEGRIWVEQPVAVLGTDMFDNETRTLPEDVFTSGIELSEEEIIGVKMYDLGGVVHYRPALYLVQLANETDMTTLSKVGEAAGLGLTLGTGAIAGLGIEATMTARVLLWADRAAFALETITSFIREHRGWIIEKFGTTGNKFLSYIDMINSASAIYGFARVTIAMAQVVNQLRIAYQNWRTATRIVSTQLSEEELNIIQQTNQQIDSVLNQSDEIRNARQQGTESNQIDSSSRPQSSATELQQTQVESNTPMPESLKQGITNPTPPTRVHGVETESGAFVYKGVAKETLLGRTRFGQQWGNASIRAQEAALSKLETAGLDTAKIRQSFNEGGELVMDYVGQSVAEQWSSMSREAKQAYSAYVEEAKKALGTRFLHDLKRRNIAYQKLEVDGQTVHRFIAFDPALDHYTIAVGVVVGGTGGIIGSVGLTKILKQLDE